MAIRKRATPKRQLEEWLLQIGEKVIAARNGEKQETFAKRVGVSRALLIIMEKGKRSYGIEPLLRVLSGATEEPAQAVLSQQFSTTNPKHIELHRRLQELLDAGGELAVTATVNVDSVYGTLCARRKS